MGTHPGYAYPFLLRWHEEEGAMRALLRRAGGAFESSALLEPVAALAALGLEDDATAVNAVVLLARAAASAAAAAAPPSAPTRIVEEGATAATAVEGVVPAAALLADAAVALARPSASLGDGVLLHRPSSGAQPAAAASAWLLRHLRYELPVTAPAASVRAALWDASPTALLADVSRAVGGGEAISEAAWRGVAARLSAVGGVASTSAAAAAAVGAAAAVATTTSTTASTTVLRVALLSDPLLAVSFSAIPLAAAAVYVALGCAAQAAGGAGDLRCLSLCDALAGGASRLGVVTPTGSQSDLTNLWAELLRRLAGGEGVRLVARQAQLAVGRLCAALSALSPADAVGRASATDAFSWATVEACALTGVRGGGTGSGAASEAPAAASSAALAAPAAASHDDGIVGVGVDGGEEPASASAPPPVCASLYTSAFSFHTALQSVTSYAAVGETVGLFGTHTVEWRADDEGGADSSGDTVLFDVLPDLSPAHAMRALAVLRRVHALRDSAGLEPKIKAALRVPPPPASSAAAAAAASAAAAGASLAAASGGLDGAALCPDSWFGEPLALSLLCAAGTATTTSTSTPTSSTTAVGASVNASTPAAGASAIAAAQRATPLTSVPRYPHVELPVRLLLHECPLPLVDAPAPQHTTADTSSFSSSASSSPPPPASSLAPRLAIAFEHSPHDLAGLIEAGALAACDGAVTQRMAYQLVRGAGRALERGMVHGLLGPGALLFSEEGVLRVGGYHSAVVVSSKAAQRVTKALHEGSLGQSHRNHSHPLLSASRVAGELQRYAGAAYRVGARDGEGPDRGGGAVQLSRGYVAPETLLGVGTALPATDAWGVGCLLVAVFTGATLFAPDEAVVAAAAALPSVIRAGHPDGALSRAVVVASLAAIEALLGRLDRAWPAAAVLPHFGFVAAALHELRGAGVVSAGGGGNALASRLASLGLWEDRRGLVMDLLRVDPADRKGVRDCLSHPFFKTQQQAAGVLERGGGSSTASPSSSFSAATLERLSTALAHVLPTGGDGAVGWWYSPGVFPAFSQSMRCSRSGGPLVRAGASASADATREGGVGGGGGDGSPESVDSEAMSM